MSGKSKMRWGQSDAEKLAKKVERFNSKVYRVNNRHPEIADIQPETIKKAEIEKLVEQFKNAPRSEFNKYLNELDRYSNLGAEKKVTNKQGFSTTVYAKKEMQYDIQEINRERKKEYDRVAELEATSRGEKIGLKRGEMGSERLNELKPKKFDFNKIRNKTEWRKLKASTAKQTAPNAKQLKLEEYKMNYIKALSRVGGDYAYDTIRKLKQLPAELITEVYYREQEASIKFVYEKQELDTIIEIIDDIWEDVYGDNEHLAAKSNWTIDMETELNEWIEKGW